MRHVATSSPTIHQTISVPTFSARIPAIAVLVMVSAIIVQETSLLQTSRRVVISLVTIIQVQTGETFRAVVHIIYLTPIDPHRVTYLPTTTTTTTTTTITITIIMEVITFLGIVM
jgi:hypothetical protein